MTETARLLKQIEADALDPEADLARALRRVINLGGVAGSDRLREWASQELKGYESDSGLPGYRQCVAPLLLDGITGTFQVTGQSISPLSLPEFARATINEKVELRMALAELIHLLRGPEETVKMQPSGASDLVLYFNASSENPHQYIQRLYWQVSKSSIAKAIDGVRTTLVELVSEIRAGLGESPDIEVPRELADQVVKVVVDGNGNRVEFGQFAVATGRSKVRASSSGSKERWAWIAAVGTLLGAVAALGALLADVF